MRRRQSNSAPAESQGKRTLSLNLIPMPLTRALLALCAALAVALKVQAADPPNVDHCMAVLQAASVTKGGAEGGKEKVDVEVEAAMAKENSATHM